MTNFIKTKITLSIDKMNIIKRFIKFKFFWRKPAERNILVYDRVSEKFANILFSKNSYSFYDVRFESINIYVLFKTLFNSGLSNLRTNYKLNYFRFINPKIIYTSIDNNIGFCNQNFSKACYVSDQNGIRTINFFLIVKNFKKRYRKTGFIYFSVFK